MIWIGDRSKDDASNGMQSRAASIRITMQEAEGRQILDSVAQHVQECMGTAWSRVPRLFLYLPEVWASYDRGVTEYPSLGEAFEPPSLLVSPDRCSWGYPHVAYTYLLCPTALYSCIYSAPLAPPALYQFVDFIKIKIKLKKELLSTYQQRSVSRLEPLRDVVVRFCERYACMNLAGRLELGSRHPFYMHQQPAEIDAVGSQPAEHDDGQRPP